MHCERHADFGGLNNPERGAGGIKRCCWYDSQTTSMGGALTISPKKATAGATVDPVSTP